jgi:hypothetical protein
LSDVFGPIVRPAPWVGGIKRHFFNGLLGRAYIRGLFKTEAGKRNMERMNEELELSGAGYQGIQQIITDSTWLADNLISQIARDTSDF